MYKIIVVLVVGFVCLIVSMAVDRSLGIVYPDAGSEVLHRLVTMAEGAVIAGVIFS